MVEIIAGNKGKGKTKVLISKANDSALLTNGSVVFLDNFDMFCGFLYGIASQDHDLELMFLDSFLTIAHLENSEIQKAIDFLVEYSEKQDINLVISLSMNASDLP